MRLQRDDTDPVLRPLEQAERTHCEMVTSRPGRFDLAVCRAVELHVEFMAVGVGVEQGNIEILPLAAAFAVKQRESDRGRRVHAGHDVADAGHGERRRSVRLADHAHDAAVSLRDVIEPGQRGELPLLAEG